MVVDSNGTMLRLTAVEKPVPAPYSILARKVSDIAATVDELAQRGVTFVCGTTAWSRTIVAFAGSTDLPAG